MFTWVQGSQTALPVSKEALIIVLYVINLREGRDSPNLCLRRPSFFVIFFRVVEHMLFKWVNQLKLEVNVIPKYLLNI